MNNYTMAMSQLQVYRCATSELMRRKECVMIIVSRICFVDNNFGFVYLFATLIVLFQGPQTQLLGY